MGTWVALIVILFTQATGASRPVAELKFTPQQILAIVAQKMKVTLDPKITPPTIRYENQTPLEDFQAVTLRQWGMKAEKFSNVFSVETNEIYLIDDPAYYNKLHRYIDDSLAHEYVHFIQVRYQNGDLSQDDTLEYEAIDIQTWFRETYFKTN